MDAPHSLGTALPPGLSATEALEQAGLTGWDIRKAPLAAFAAHQWLVIPGRYATMRDTDFMGLVGETYRVVQNEHHAHALDTFAEESGASFRVAGELDGGRKVFVTMELPGHMRIGGKDTVGTYVTALWSHDASTVFSLLISPVHARREALLNAAHGGLTNVIRMRGPWATEALDRTFDYLEAFQADAQRLIGVDMSQADFERMTVRELGAPKGASPATVTRTENKLARMSELFAGGTAWGAYTTIAEWADHHAPTRGDERDTARAANAVLDPRFKTKALQVVKATAGLV